MNKKISLILSLIYVCSIGVFGQTKDYKNLFSEKTLRANIKFLSDDGFEGRAPGSRSGELAAKFIANQLENYGLRGAGANGSFFQPVALVGVKADPNTTLNVSGKNGTVSYKFADDFVAFTGAQTESVKLDGDLVYVGYGINAPEQKWNDYKGNAADYRGKILVMMVNDPPATQTEPNLFGAKALTYYGRWTYKYEQAARMGASGVILIHTTDSAGYGWNVVRTSNGNWRYDVARNAEDKTPFLQMRSWMTEDTAQKIFAQAGQNLDALRERAKTRDFQPVNLGLRAKVDLNSQLKRLDSNNVVAVWDGKDAKLKDEYVVYSAHWDHLGMGEADKNGDNIYNGALDNATGCASVLAIAEAITKLPADRQPKRSSVFLFPTAEEQGLLGADWYSKHPLFPPEKTAANINIDGGNLYGLTNDYGALGAERSTMMPVVNDVLKERRMTFAQDAHPEQGSFFRSDHFPFARIGVPSISVRSGVDYIGKPKDYAEKTFDEFNKNNYHQPSDNFDESWQYDGLIQMIEVSMAIGLKIADAPTLPHFNAGDEFSGAQPTRK
jgi:Zn-dependent M28 family amino/carboxypeptidase